MGKLYATYVKRALDILIAAILGIPAAVVVALCCLMVRLESPGPAVFTQERPGRGGKVFLLYKLRSMRVETEKNGKPLSDMERMTKTGRFMRRCSIDELPQLWNILKGDMSFIGPRPLLVCYLPLYTAEQMRRHEVRPGISGWAQVNGRNAIAWEDKFRYDVWYVDHISFGLDIKIFWMTVKNVLLRKGIDAGAEDTMPVFKGSEQA